MAEHLKIKEYFTLQNRPTTSNAFCSESHLCFNLLHFFFLPGGGPGGGPEGGPGGLIGGAGGGPSGGGPLIGGPCRCGGPGAMGPVGGGICGLAMRWDWLSPGGPFSSVSEPSESSVYSSSTSSSSSSSGTD